jgi:hypothetical protein
MRRLAALAVALALAPSAALACPGCVSAPYGDRTFGWAYLLLYAAPFFIASGIAGALVYYSRSASPAPAGARRLLRILRPRRRKATAVSGCGTADLLEAHGLDKETT